ELSQRDGLDFRPPGGESRRELIARQHPFWRRIGKLNDTIVAITHKGVIEATMAAATGWDMRTKRPAKVGLGASHLFKIDREGGPSVIQLNVTGEIKQ
ncbi:MAG: histidine phosphatase family protein, partial [Fimbriimonadaceae bacterium]|nr:histidine phosphatase family protein [Alphaproteobacteria bacterium]